MSGVRIKIDRAKKHLADLDAAIKAFESREPCTFVMEIDAKSGYEIYRFREREAIPIEWGAIVGDCVHNLRSSLDLLANELVRHGGGTPGDYTAFPIGSSETHFRTSAIKRLNGASAATIECVMRLKPYPGGNEPLFRLHQIDIADKHVLLIPVAAAQRDFGVRNDIIMPGMESLSPPIWGIGKAVNRKFPLKDGDELIAYRRGTGDGFEDKTEFKFGFEIAFGEGQIFDGDPVVPTLHQLVNFTERLIDIFAQNIFGLSIW